MKIPQKIIQLGNFERGSNYSIFQLNHIPSLGQKPSVIDLTYSPSIISQVYLALRKIIIPEAMTLERITWQGNPTPVLTSK